MHLTSICCVCSSRTSSPSSSATGQVTSTHFLHAICIVPETTHAVRYPASNPALSLLLAGNKTLSVAPGIHAWHGRAFLKNPNWPPRASLADTVHILHVRARDGTDVGKGNAAEEVVCFCAVGSTRWSVLMVLSVCGASLQIRRWSMANRDEGSAGQRTAASTSMEGCEESTGTRSGRLEGRMGGRCWNARGSCRMRHCCSGDFCSSQTPRGPCRGSAATTEHGAIRFTTPGNSCTSMKRKPTRSASASGTLFPTLPSFPFVDVSV